MLAVALRKESVDRNFGASIVQKRTPVALRKESVDRNPQGLIVNIPRYASLSARRAWIEIARPGCWRAATSSLSARRAWIEIQIDRDKTQWEQVALRKESVDRNFVPFDVIRPAIDGRSPQGERG